MDGIVFIYKFSSARRISTVSNPIDGNEIIDVPLTILKLF